VSVNESARVLAALGRFYERRAGRVEPLGIGVALVTPDLPMIRALNFVRVDRWHGTAEELVAATDEIQSRLRIAHRKTVLLDQELIDRLWPEIMLLHLPVAKRFLLMGRRCTRTAPVDSVEVAELPPDEYLAARAACMREDHGDREEVIRQALELQRRIAAAFPTLYFGVRSGGVVAAYASLHLDDDVAQIEDVETRAAQRRRGYASAVIRRAVSKAGAAGAGIVYLATTEDDWPQHLYRKLGFDALASEVIFGRPQ
jgi:ribosomal protein S18 acetylase RimI-like enzyme